MGIPPDLLFLLLIEAASFALYAFAFVVAARVAFVGGFAAGVAFLAAFVDFGRVGRCGEAVKRAQREQEEQYLHDHKFRLSRLPRMLGCGPSKLPRGRVLIGIDCAKNSAPRFCLLNTTPTRP